MRPKRPEYDSIPHEFITDHWDKAVDNCEDEAGGFCYCGRLLTRLHTTSCRKFKYHVRSKLRTMYDNFLKEKAK